MAKFFKKEAQKIHDILLSNRVNYWTGDQGKLFEKKFSKFSKTKFSVAVANGTVALDLALIALGIGQGDEVLVTPRSYIASASAISNAGAKPIFVDVDANSQNISPTQIEGNITFRTKAIVCVHFAGWPCEMQDITKLQISTTLKSLKIVLKHMGPIIEVSQLEVLEILLLGLFAKIK